MRQAHFLFEVILKITLERMESAEKHAKVEKKRKELIRLCAVIEEVTFPEYIPLDILLVLTLVLKFRETSLYEVLEL